MTFIPLLANALQKAEKHGCQQSPAGYAKGEDSHLNQIYENAEFQCSLPMLFIKQRAFSWI